MRKLMWFSVGFGAACLAGIYLCAGAASMVISGAVFLTLGIGCAVLRSKAQWLSGAAAICFGGAVGLMWFAAFCTGTAAAAKNVSGTVQPVCAEITSYSWEGKYGSVADGSVELEGRRFSVRLYFSGYPALLPGDRVEGSFRLQQTVEPESGSPAFHRGQGIFLLGYQKGEISVTNGESTWKHLPAVINRRITDLLDELFSPEDSAFARALLLGDKTKMSYETQTDLRVSGISHVVAVSGLHVSILFAVLYVLCGKRRLPLALIGIPVLMLFAAVTGFTPSVTRAAVMEILVILALLLGREYDPPTALAFAVLVILVKNPYAASSVSLQMSVSSVAGIFLFTPRIYGRLNPTKKGKKTVRTAVKKYLAAGISVTLGAMTLTTPLVAVYFGAVSLVGVLTNLLVSLPVTAAFSLLLLTCLAGLIFPGIAAVPAWIVSRLIRVILAVAHGLSRIPMAAVYTVSPWIVCWLVVCYCLMGLYLVLHRHGSLALFAAVIALGVCLCGSFLEGYGDACRVTVLDVGQGQSILLQAEGKTFLVDCGGDYDEDAADAAAETLLSRGILRLDGLILTHYDRDHAGGAAYVLSRVKADTLYLPGVPDTDGVLSEILAAAGKSTVILVDTDTVISFGNAKITLFAPETANEGNESCIAVLFQTEKCDTLITGDMSAYAEERLLYRAEIPKLEILVVGHHGSRYSTGDALLAATMPEVAVISVGAGNSFGHPTQEVLDRLEAYGCAVLRTDEAGTIVIRR